MLIRNVGQITIVGSLERIITIFLLRIVYSPFSLSRNRSKNIQSNRGSGESSHKFEIKSKRSRDCCPFPRERDPVPRIAATWKKREKRPWRGEARRGEAGPEARARAKRMRGPAGSFTITYAKDSSCTRPPQAASSSRNSRYTRPAMHYREYDIHLTSDARGSCMAVAAPRHLEAKRKRGGKKAVRNAHL